MIIISKKLAPYIRDVYLAYLIEGARFTREGYPIIEKWMVTKQIPKDIYQWDSRSKVKTPIDTAMSFYCVDQFFQPIISNPKKYIDKLKNYQSVIGLDASPFDNMPEVVQCSQIFVNLATTYYFGRNGLGIIPNVRLGSECTYSSLDAYPKNTLICIGTNGFVKNKSNAIIFKNQVILITKTLMPSAILVYGSIDNDIFDFPKSLGIPVYAYPSVNSRRRK